MLCRREPPPDGALQGVRRRLLTPRKFIAIDVGLIKPTLPTGYSIFFKNLSGDKIGQATFNLEVQHREKKQPRLVF